MPTTLATLVLMMALAPAPAAAHSCEHSKASSDSDHAERAEHARHEGHAGHAGHAETMDHSSHAATPAGHSAHPGHAADAAPAAAPAPVVENNRWTPDAPLIAGMASVREAVATLAHHEMGHMGASHVVALAGDIDTVIAGMFANCKLDPEPDIALHGLLARLMAGTQALNTRPADASPVADMRAAVQDYGRVFGDPGIDAEAGAVKGDGGL